MITASSIDGNDGNGGSGNMGAADTDVIHLTTERVACDGGGGALGHPRVWLTLGTDGQIVCPYCSRRYVRAGDEDDA